MDFAKTFNRSFKGLSSIAEGLTRPAGGGIPGVASSLIQRLHQNLPKEGEEIKTKATSLMSPIIDDSDPREDELIKEISTSPNYKRINSTVNEFVEPKSNVIEENESLKAKTWDIENSKGKTFTVTQKDLDILSRTIAAEARGESVLGQAAVAHVALNRLVSQHGGKENLTDILLDTLQFSAWNSRVGYSDMRNIYKNSTDPVYLEKLKTAHGGKEDGSKLLLAYDNAKSIAIAVLDGRIDDPTYGSNHYFSNKGKNKVKKIPNWYSRQLGRAKNNKYQIGSHLFTGRGRNYNTTYETYDYRLQNDFLSLRPRSRNQIKGLMSQNKRWNKLNSMDIYDEQ